MKRSAKIAALCAASLVLCGTVGLFGCGNNQSSDSGSVSVYDTSQGVAATVNDVEIGEAAVTNYMQNFRVSSGLAADADFAQWMVDNAYTPSDLRNDVIDYYVDQEVVRIAAAELGVSVSAEEVDAQVNNIRGYYEDEDAWTAALAAQGLTEQEYREMVEMSLLVKGAKESLDLDAVISDEDKNMYAQMFAVSYDGAKKSSHILFAADDQQTAQAVYEQLQNGEITWDEAVAQYSLDTASAADNGNVGWDKMTQFVSEYQTALDGLNPGEMSAPVESSFGYHIILCTEVYTAPDDVNTMSISDLPSDWQDQIIQSLTASAEETAYNNWIQEYKSGLTITINEMPSGLVYDVSTEGLTPSEGSYAASLAQESTEGPSESTE